MGSSIADLAREKRKRTQEAKKARILAEKRRQAEATKLLKEQALRKSALEKQLQAARRADKLAISKIIRKCYQEAYKGRCFIFVGSATEKHRKKLKRMGFSLSAKDINQLQREQLTKTLGILRTEQENLPQKISQCEWRCRDFLGLFGSFENPLLSPDKTTDGRLLNLAKALELLARPIASINNNYNYELNFLRGASASEIAIDYGLEGWPEEQILKFRRQRMLAIQIEKQKRGNAFNVISEDQVSELVKLGSGLIGDFRSNRINIDSAEKKLSSLKIRKCLAISWDSKPKLGKAEFLDYAKLFWIISSAGISAFKVIFDYILRNSSKSKVTLDQGPPSRGTIKIRVGRSNVEIPGYMESRDIARRIKNEGLSVSVINKGNGAYRHVVSW